MASLTELKQMRDAAQSRLDAAVDSVNRLKARVKVADEAIKKREAELRAELEA